MKLKLIVLLILISFIPIAIIIFNGIPIGADFQNHFRFVLPFYDEILKGNYLPGWLAESNNGFGDPRFRFYPPLLYYALCLVRLITADWYVSTIIVFAFFTFVGTFGVYLWTKQSFSNTTAIIAGLLFTFVPYHLAQLFQASLLAEFVATSLLPYSFLFVERLTTNNYKKEDGNIDKSALSFDIVGLACSYSLIVISHLPTTVVASIALGLFALLLIDWRSNLKSLVWCGGGILLGLVSSSWFWFRMLSELSWIQAGENVSSPYYAYWNNFLFSPFSLSNLNTWFGSLILALTLIYFLPSVNIIRQLFNKESFKSFSDLINISHIKTLLLRKRLFAHSLIILFTVFMTTDLSRPIWAIVPKLKDIQFPYRWLAITSVVICPLIAASMVVWGKYLKKNGLRPVLLVLSIVLLLNYIYIIKELVIDSEFLSRQSFYEEIEKSRGARSFNDWLPKKAKELKDLLPLKGNVDAGERIITIINWGSHNRQFLVGEGNEKTARIRSYNYPLWQAFILKDGQRTPTQTSSESDGTLLVEIPTDESKIEITFVEPSRTIYGVWISLIGWITILSLLIQRFIKSLKK